MATTVMLTGDVNLMGVQDTAVPFRSVRETFKRADAVFCNLECCLYEPPVPRTMMPDEVSGYEGFYAPPTSGRALQLGGFHCVGNANNQNYGPEQIMASNACLDELGIPHVGTGVNRAAARVPAIVTRNGKRMGFLGRFIPPCFFDRTSPLYNWISRRAGVLFAFQLDKSKNCPDLYLVLLSYSLS